MPSSSARRTWVIPWFRQRRRTVDPNRRFRCLHFANLFALQHGYCVCEQSNCRPHSSESVINKKW